MTGSTLSADVVRTLETALGSRVTDVRRVGGGAIDVASAVTFLDGREVFVKTHTRPDPRMFPCEARGLEWLRDADAIRVPRLLAVSDEHASGPSFLALELIVSAPRRPDYDERLGRGLAALHRAGADGFGLPYDNFIADLPQANAPLDDWPSFYARRRLEPQLSLALQTGRAPTVWATRFDRILDRLPDLLGPDEPPARLHGDLWSGNLLVDERGDPCLVDPAVYGGHREIDLGMLSLFGSPGPRFWSAYDEVFPRLPGASERTDLYQLYPLLVHVTLFGGTYVGAVDAVVDRYL